jgi:hypothetical protein
METVVNVPNHGSSGFNVNIGGCGIYDPDGNWFTGIIDDVAIFHEAGFAEYTLNIPEDAD